MAVALIAALAGDNYISSVEWVNVAIVGVGACAVFYAPNVPHARVTKFVMSALAAVLTVAAFALPATGLVYAPALPVALVALAVGQMGVHLVFFLHITTGPDNVNNVLALAFGLLIVGLVLIGSIWIMAHLNAEMMSPEMLQAMQR